MRAASVVLDPVFIAQKNIRLGYGLRTDAQWLSPEQIPELAAADNPEGAGTDAWWLSVTAFDHFLAGFARIVTHESDPRRGSLEIYVANTDSAGQGGRHWFLVAFVIE